MSLGAANTYWNNARKSASVQETWLVRLWHGNESGSNYISISDHDLTVGDFYAGFVIDFGRISEKIDLLKSKSSIGNIEIRCRNLYAGQSFAKKLWGTSTYFINRKVDIYSRMGDATSLGNCVQIYQGRLFNIEQKSDSIIILHIEQKKPQDFISIPQTKTPRGTDVPVIYGNYTVNASTQASQAFCTSKALWPMPVEFVTGGTIQGVAYAALSSEARMHFYESSIDQFIPITDASNNYQDTSRVQFTYNAVVEDHKLYRGFKMKPTSVGEGNGAGAGVNAIDLDGDDSGFTTAAGANVTATDGNSAETELILDCPEVTGTVTTFTQQIRYNLTFDQGGSGSSVKARNLTFGNTNQIATQSSGSSGDQLQSSANDMTTNYGSNDNNMPEFIKIGGQAIHGIGDDCICLLEIHDVHLNIKAILDFGTGGGSDTDKAKAANAKGLVEKIKFMYCGADGFAKGYNGGSGTASLIHEIFRDLMDRFAGFDVADAALDGWSALNTARSGWTARAWIMKPRELESILNRLQFEGGFIFKYAPDGGRFIHVANTYSSGDVTHTITENDVENISTVLTDFSDVVTDVTYHYNIHPDTRKFINTTNYINETSARANYWPSIAGEENKKQINMEYLTDDPKASGDSDPNDAHALYYDNIYADPKILVSCDIINKNMFNLEIGDIVQFSITDMDIKYGFATTFYFMITRTKRALNNLSITAREVYQV